MEQSVLPPETMNQKLWEAAKAGDTKLIRILAMAGVDIDVRNENGFTAFNIATQHGHSDAAMTILAAREMQYARTIGVDPVEFLQVGQAEDADKKTA